MTKHILLTALPLFLLLSADASAKGPFAMAADTHVPRKTALASTNAPEPVVAEEAPDADTEKKPPIEPPHFTLALDSGPSITSVDVGSVHFLSLHAHLGMFVGHELVAGTIFNDRASISLGYMGAIDGNGAELIHRHGVGFMLSKSWLSFAIGGGFGFLHGFDDGSTFIVPGLQTSLAFRIGRFSIGLPIDVDFVGAPATTFALTFGYAH